MLRSSSTLLLARTDYNMKTYGARAFAISAPGLWNQLPDDIKSIDNLTNFKSKLRPIVLISLSKINFYLNFILFIYLFLFLLPCEYCVKRIELLYMRYINVYYYYYYYYYYSVYLRSCCFPP